jgi:WD40 repeat protein
MAAACPSREQLEHLLRATLTEAEQAGLLKHLDACGDCRRRLELLAGGVEDWIAKAAQGPAPIPPQLGQMMKQMAAGDTVRVPIPSTDQTLALGATLRYFGDYEILEELGRGGMGVVYRARQVSLNRFVALKLILAGQLASESEVRRFRTEAEAAARLDHPNIVPIYEIGEHDGRQYFSMKWVEGGALSERISNRQFQISNHNAAALLAAIARAVHYAHQRGVLHRDLKPSNILLDAQGQPHLTDFGLAKMLDRNSGLTHSGSVMGTPNYLAPEVAAGKTKEVTTAADVFSLGAILYELLTGRPPFEAETVAATLQNVLNAEPPSPRSLNPSVPRDLEIICLKALEKEPGRRYGSAELLADELDRFARGEPILARPATSLGRLIKWTKRKPALAGSLAALVFVFAGGLAGVVWKWRAEVSHRRLAQQESARALHAVTRLEIERAESLLQVGDSSRGLAYLARLLRQQPTNRVVAERLINALSYRPFCLPVAPLRHGKPLNSLPDDQKDTMSGIVGFDLSVITADFSPDGRLVITASGDGNARLWDTLTGQPVGEPLRHQAEVVWAQFSGDGQRVVTASVDGSARLWAVPSGQLTIPPLRHDGIVHFASFSPDNQRVVTAARDRTARIWNVRTGQPIAVPLLHPMAVYFCCFSPDGKLVLTADESRHARLWDAATGVCLGTADHFYFKGASKSHPAFSPDSAEVLTLYHHHATLRDLRVETPKSARFSHESFVFGASYSPDDRSIATVSHDTTARIWDVRTGETVAPALRHEHWVTSADFSGDAQILVTASRDNSARLWEVRTGRALAEPLAHGYDVRTALMTPDRRHAVTIIEGDAAWLWDVRIAQPLVVLRYLPTAARFITFSRDGRHLLVVNESEEARVWDAHSGRDQTRAVRHGNNRYITKAQFSPDGRRWATASEDGSVLVWDTATGDAVSRPLRHEGLVSRVDFSPDGKRLVTAGEHTPRVWDVESGTHLLKLRQAGNTMDARFSSDGRFIVTAGTHGTVTISDAETGELCQGPLVHDRAVFWAAFDPTGERVASGCGDKAVRIWSVQTGKMLVPPMLHTDEVRTIDERPFSSDGTKLVTMAGSSVQVWNVRTGKAATTPLRHGGLVHTAQFSPDGRRILTASEEGIARLWDTETGHPLSEPMRHGSRVTSAEFSPDGSRVVTCSSDKAVRIWEMTSAPLPVPGWLPALAEAIAGQHVDALDVSEVGSLEDFYQLRQRLLADTKQTYYARWARWFFEDSASRTVSPSSDVTVPEYVRRRIEENTLESLREATLLCATNALAFARLAESLTTSQRSGSHKRRAFPEDAEWFSRYATNLAPADPEVLRIRESVVQKLRETRKTPAQP